MEKINGRTPEEIKAGLRFCTTGKVPGYGCNVSCPYLNTPNCWLPVKSDALALIDRLEAALKCEQVARDVLLEEVPKWISVEERLPEEGERVLCTDGYCVFEQYRAPLCFVYGAWERGGLKSPMQNVTHWMPLPEPPEVSE